MQRCVLAMAMSERYAFYYTATDLGEVCDVRGEGAYCGFRLNQDLLLKWLAAKVPLSFFLPCAQIPGAFVTCRWRP